MSNLDLRLYLVTDHSTRYPRGLLEGVAEAVAGGVTLVQYRATDGSRREHYETARALLDMLGSRGVPLVINDQVDLALAIGADGVHVGQNDLPAAVVRQRVGPSRLVGLSITHEGQLKDVPAGVDYLGAGPVFPTGSKADAAPALGLDMLKRITAASPLPVVAIGGISLENARDVFSSGVAGVAVISALSLAPDPAAVARRLLAERP